MEGAAFIENRDADHSDIARIAIFFLGIRLPDRTEAKRRDSFGTLAKAFHHQCAVWIDESTASSRKSLWFRTAIE
jgi:hypothetical protein